MPTSKAKKAPPLQNESEKERLRIAKMLHDGPCQTFTSAQLLAQVLLRNVEEGIKGNAKLCENIADTLTAGVSEIHAILNDLRSGASGLFYEGKDSENGRSGATVEASKFDTSRVTGLRSKTPRKNEPGTPAEPRKRIFIVDDHRMMRQGLRVFIERESDLEVCGEADNGTEALPLILETQPDAIIVDISLPGMNGIEFLKNLKAQLSDIAAIVVSMHDEGVYAERALRAGARAYVMKKEAAEEIIVALRHALNGDYHVSKGVAGSIFHKALGTGGHGKTASVSPVTLLSDRELEVFELIGQGKSTRDIAKLLRLSGKTVDTHRAHIKQKCGLASNSEMIQHAIIWMEHAGVA